MKNDLSMLQFKALLALSSNAISGYQISNLLKANSGAVYRSLKDLESEGLVKFIKDYEWNPLGPVRKIYSITQKGRDYVSSEYKFFHHISRKIG